MEGNKARRLNELEKKNSEINKMLTD